MNVDSSAIRSSNNHKLLIISAWIGMLLMSDLPDIIFDTFTGSLPSWLSWAKVGWIAVFLAACLMLKMLRPLWQFGLVMLVFFLAIQGSVQLAQEPAWQALFVTQEPSFSIGFLELFIRDSLIMLAVLATLWLIKRSRADFFLVKGDLAAPIQPVPWLGIKTGESWRVFGWIFGGSAAVLVLIPTVLALKPSGETLLRAAGLLPVVLLVIVVNAFNEEIYYRASMLSTLPAAVGRTHALLISITFFGLAHYLYGSPPGIVGFLMTGFLAFLMGKAMLETKGIVWPIVIHILPDAVIFFSYAIAWFQPSP